MRQHEEAAPMSAEADTSAPKPPTEPPKDSAPKAIEAWGAEKLGVEIDPFTGAANPVRWKALPSKSGSERGFYERSENCWQWDGLLCHVGFPPRAWGLGKLISAADFDEALAEMLDITIGAHPAAKQEG